MENKGKFNGVCNLSSCKTSLPATWYNQGSYAYYCPVCAQRLNSDPYNKRDALRLFNSELCVNKEE